MRTDMTALRPPAADRRSGFPHSHDSVEPARVIAGGHVDVGVHPQLHRLRECYLCQGGPGGGRADVGGVLDAVGVAEWRLLW